MFIQKRRQIVTIAILSLLLTFLQIAGWQISMDYGSSVHQSGFFQNIGFTETWQCVLAGILEWLILCISFSFLFSWLEKREQNAPKAIPTISPRFIWLISFTILFIIWMVFLWGCYPGFYNYDIGHQLPQFLYEEVPYNAHHPLVHTLFCGTIIKLGYLLHPIDLSLGVFFYNAVQMAICALCLSYSLQFIYKRTWNKILTALALLFYAICPPIVMFAMSTTKDVLCHAFLLVAVLKLWELYQKMDKNENIKTWDWIRLGIMLSLSCLLRKNIIYAIVVFAVFSLFFVKKMRCKQVILYIGIFAVYFLINKGLLIALDAIPGSVNEAMCVPYQQIARLYTQEGKSAFTDEEYAMLSEVINPKALFCYDPVMADHTKSNFNPGLETIMNHKWDYFVFWIKKGFQYPKIYLDSILYNTYQAWYPGTSVTDASGPRYFMITTWQDEYGTPHWQGLYNFYSAISDNSYTSYPVLRLFFSTGAMFWVCIITWFYGIWKKDKGIITSLLLVLLVCGTTFLGPVSDVRYYLILFYLMPLCLGLMLQKKNPVEEH